MDMYQKRKIRAEKKNNNQEEKLTKVGINWYPGHMAKTRKQIMEDLKLVDIVIELLDARIPLASQNPDIGEITKNKKKIVVLNKCDLADENKNKKWIEYFNQQNIPAVLTDANSGKGIEECIRKIEKVMKENMKEQADKGRIGRKIRAMIIGIPNVGKSSFINRISKKTSAGVGNKPGVTKQKQWIRVNEKIELLDTPGVLWPKFDSEEVGLKLAFTGTIKEEILQRTEIAYYLVKFLLENYIELLCSRYKLNIQEIKEKLQRVDRPENENIYEVFLDIGRKRGCIISGGNIDEEKTARIILDEFKNGKIGKITLE
ncbi:MAG: ribosome biogenesis GTPase YlqF [Clostridia bacterium]